MGKVYSRNIAQQQLFCLEICTKSAKGNQNAEGLSADVPDLNEISQGCSAAFVSDVHGQKPMDRSLAILKERERERERERAHILQMGGKLLRESFVGGV